MYFLCSEFYQVKIWFQNRRYKVKRQAQDKSIEEATTFQHNLRCSSDTQQCVFPQSHGEDESSCLPKIAKVDRSSTNWTHFISSTHSRPCTSRVTQSGVQAFANWPDRYPTTCPIPSFLSEHWPLSGANYFSRWSSFSSPTAHMHNTLSETHPVSLIQSKSPTDPVQTNQTSLDCSFYTQWENSFPLSRTDSVQHNSTMNCPIQRYPYNGWSSIPHDSIASNADLATPNLMEYLTIAGWKDCPTLSPLRKLEMEKSHESHTHDLPLMSYKENELQSPFVESTHPIPGGHTNSYENNPFSETFPLETGGSPSREPNPVGPDWPYNSSQLSETETSVKWEAAPTCAASLNEPSGHEKFRLEHQRDLQFLFGLHNSTMEKKCDSEKLENG